MPAKNAKNPKATKQAKPAAKSKQTKAKKSVSSAPAPAPAPAPSVVEPVVTESSSDSAPTSSPLHDEYASLLSKCQQLNAIISSVRTSVRELEKKTTRELKAAQKAKAKSRRGNRAPSGFVMPAKISDELANFLGKEQGSEMARTEVTREINAYIREHKLQDSNNGRIINADESLSKLLKLGAKDELTYFNLQRYMSPHFAKASKKSVSA